jgi:hypothetical protein
MIKQIFGFPFYVDNINDSLFDKKKIIKDIEYNYKKDKHRNVWEDSKGLVDSNLHHSYSDMENSNFKKINYSKLLPIYTKVITNFLNNFKFKKLIKFNFNIVNYTCMTSSQYMKSHYHPESDFTAVHYIKYDNTIHKPTLFENSDFSKFTRSLRPNLYNLLDSSDINHSWYYENYFLNIKENDICITPSFLFHSVPMQPKTDFSRITIVLNISIE